MSSCQVGAPRRDAKPKSGRGGSNSRHSAWEADALPTELRPPKTPKSYRGAGMSQSICFSLRLRQALRMSNFKLFWGMVQLEMILLSVRLFRIPGSGRLWPADHSRNRRISRVCDAAIGRSVACIRSTVQSCRLPPEQRLVLPDATRGIPAENSPDTSPYLFQG